MVKIINYRSIISTSCFVGGLTISTLCVALPETSQPNIPSSDKGDFKYSNIDAWPATTLDLGPVQQQVGRAAAKRCGTALAAAPLDFGKAPSFIGKMAANLASTAASKLLGGLLGGGGGNDEEPDLKKDPIKNKLKKKFSDDASKVRIKMGGNLSDKELLLSTHIDKSKFKGTFHTIFLEKSDCTRIWPENTWGYKLWGSWTLSVSVTKTTRNYENGKLVNESVDKSGWSKSGNFDYSDNIRLFGVNEDTQELELMINPKTAFLNQLKSELQTPLWQKMGFGKPTKGLRSIGASFPGLTAEDIGNDTVAIVHVTHVKKGRYKTVGFPIKLNIGTNNNVNLEQLPANF